jgi:hypothetical protein
MHTRFNCHKRAIGEFGDRNKCAPVRIVFFRDGLSEGEYEITGKEEIGDIMGELVQRPLFLIFTVSTRRNR